MSRRSLRAEDGFLLPGAIALLAIFVVLTGTAIALSLNSLDHTNHDRRVMRALQAADAGVDVAIFLLNHLLVSSSVTAALGPIPDAVASARCMSISAGTITIHTTQPGDAPYCLSQSGTAGDVEGATYSYQTSTAISLTLGVDNLVIRNIVSTGMADGAQRRVLVKVRLVLGGAGSLALYQRIRHTECTASPTTAAVDSGCPGADLTN